jgi:pyruvate/2-oxoglutarate dehydrogenase complex dihydrolipoamide acyltransferase (E2) component
MKRREHAYQLVPFPKVRRALIDAIQVAQRKRLVHGLIEVDVTKAHAFIHAYKARTGESLSFTAFIIACLARALDENKYMHAYRQGRKRLIIFDEVDVGTIIESEAGHYKLPIPYVIRAANHKSIREIHEEIRRVQQARSREEDSLINLAKLYPHVPGFVGKFFWRLLEGHPKLKKRWTGTCGVTSLGMFGKGSGWGLPLTNYVLNITLGGIAQKPGVVDGRIELREYLCITVSIDHDLIDGAPATRFVSRFKDQIEQGYGLETFESTPALVTPVT